MVNQMGDAFDNLAMAATAKQDTMDSLVKSIANLTDANARLTKTNQSLTQQLQKKGGSGGGNSGGGGSSSNSDNQTKTWPAWTDPDAYCFTCGYKLCKDHCSGTCPKAKDHPGHKKEGTRANPMGGSLKDAGWGNKPDGKARQ